MTGRHRVLVLGMHRSGTSAVAGALVAAGLSLGERAQLVGPDRTNPEGHFERSDVVRLNDRMLAQLGWAWDTPDAAPLADPPELPELVAAGRELVVTRMPASEGWVTKDPRISLLLPWWRQILDDDFIAVVCVRPPEEVASSISARNGFPAELGLALWAAYGRHLAAGLAGHAALVVDYTALASDPQRVMPQVLDGLEQLGLSAALDASAAVTRIKPEHRRQVAGARGGVVFGEQPWLADLRAAWLTGEAVWSTTALSVVIPPASEHEVRLLEAHRRAREATDAEPRPGTRADEHGSPAPATHRSRRSLSHSPARALVRRAKPLLRLGARAAALVQSRNPLLDVEWYFSQYPDLAGAGVDAHQHYHRHGWREGRNPNPYFVTEWYLDQYADVRELGIDPLDHYLRSGAAEGRDPGPLFSTHDYLRRHPELNGTGANPLLHFLRAEDDDDAVAGDLPIDWRTIAGAVAADARIAGVGAAARAPSQAGVAITAFPATRGERALARGPSGTGLAIVAQLEHARSTGLEYLVVPRRPPEWWARLSTMAEHLGRYHAHDAGGGVLYDLRQPAAAGDAGLAAAVERFRLEFGRAPAILDLSGNGGLPSIPAAASVFRSVVGGDSLPYADASVDLVVVDDPAREAEARRVARSGVLREAGGAIETVAWTPGQRRLPSVSIIIPTHAHPELLGPCLDAVLATLPPTIATQVIVVDDASPPDSAAAIDALMARHPQAQLVRNESNLGFLRSVNRGASQAVGDYLVLLNDDTLPLPGWLTALVEAALDNPQAGVLGGRLVYPNGSIQEAGGVIFADGQGAKFRTGDRDPEAPTYSYLREVDYVSGALLMTPRALFEEIGGLDPAYGFGYYEDADYCFAVRARGRGTLYVPGATIVHVEGGTAGRDVRLGAKRSQASNAGVFRARWREALRDQPHPSAYLGGPGVRERPRGRPAVLVADSSLPEHDRHAGGRTMHEFVTLLRGAGIKVAFHTAGEPREPYASELQAAGVELVTQAGLDAWLRANGPALHAALVARPTVGEPLVPKLRRWSPARIVYYTHDLHYLRERRRYEATGSATALARSQEMLTVETAIFEAVDCVATPSEAEAEVVAALTPGTQVRALTAFAYQVSDDPPARAGRQRLLFVGGFGHAPNVDAVQFLAGEVMPLIWARRPDACLDIVGAGPPPHIAALASPTVNVLGYVPDLEPYYRRALLAVAPLRFGAGVKGKIAEAMAAGVPVATTSVGMEGIAARPMDAIVEDDPAALAGRILDVMADDSMWGTYARRGQALAARLFSTQAARDRLLSALGLEEVPRQ